MDLEDLIPYLNQPRMYEDYIAAVCPWHESEPVRQSLLIYPTRWKCMSCDRWGRDMEWLERELQGLPPIVNLDDDKFQYPPFVNAMATYALSCHKKVIDTPHLGAYWIKRGISRNTVIACKLGFSQGWYTIPIYDINNNIVRIVHRAGPSIKRPIAKYYTTKGKSVPYCPDMDFSASSWTLYVVYGIVDALALYEMGYASITSSMGKENFNPEWLRMSSTIEVVFIPDKGEANTAREQAKAFGPRASVLDLNYDFYTDCKDPADFLANGHEDALAEMMELWLRR
jgi:hypothetical protein